MNDIVYLDEPLDGRPLPQPGQLFQVWEETPVNLWCDNQEGLALGVVRMAPGSIVMIVKAWHVEIQEEELLGDDDDDYQEENINTYYSMRLHILHNEKVYKHVQVGFNEWETKMKEVSP